MKSENRNPKPEGNQKSEWLTGVRPAVGNFGFRISSFFRLSDFGLRNF
jgi:hypothetical protein